ncbi:putative transcriptional regulator, MarR family [Bradyrhizobium sp. ORS 278]|uniref:MarR family winged helix-turn-helix transcriptional regulator n=1 Tax=Bradyrhizobium sp. (strain ORS 278) TaxID=114615 RepID=UPI0001507826|nr:MarR family transcriptional regulator [Bradyrhizobium sp. ORS 278]CAL76213.1 putative transcriptional regulator, MarR family [Bradyrhizobium sp. ORS 278]
MTAERTPIDDFLALRAKTWPEAATPIVGLMVRVFRLNSLMLEQTERLVAAHALSFTEFEVLVTLRGQPAPHQLLPTDLYSAILISSGGLTKVLHALEARGLIARGQDKDDRRSKPVRLTAKGRATAERAMRDVLEADEALIHGTLSSSEVAALTKLLGRLLRTIEPGAGPAEHEQAASPQGHHARSE